MALAPAIHYSKSLELIQFSPTFPGKTDDVVAGSLDPKYEDYVWSVAVNFKHYIDKQRNENGAQRAAFINIVDEFDVEDASKRRRDDKVSSSALWTKHTLFPFQIYFVPMVDWCCIVPQETLPSQEDLERKYGAFLFDDALNESFLREPHKIALIKDKSLRQLCVAINIILLKPTGEVSENVIDPSEDKREVMTDALFRKLAEFLGVNDYAETNLILKEQRSIKATIGKRRYYNSVNEFVIIEKDKFFVGPVLAFAEDKKLLLPSFKSFPNTIAQKAAECLAVALDSFGVGGIDTGLDQEVFAIGVRHRFFSFWHAVFPVKYLTQVGIDAGNLDPHLFTWLKTYPVSEFGLDICDPAQRLLIIQGFVAIRDYVQSGARIGKYKI
jgi:hypothetical protein